MQNKIIPFFVLVLVVVACNIPGQLAVTPVPIDPPTETTQVIPPTPTSTVIPADLPFTIDCSALPASRQADCDAFITATRDQVYPIYREVTGVSLSKCYQSIHYVILPTDPSPGAGGESAGDTITYNQKYSIDLRHRYDTHEILHSISMCTKALDNHVFHGMVMNYAYDRLGVYDIGYFTDKNSDDLTVNLDFLLENVKTASGSELMDSCIGILMRKISRVYFELGGESVQRLYQSTIYPPTIASQPNPNLVSVWGSKAEQVEALLETLKQDYQYNLLVPECGY